MYYVMAVPPDEVPVSAVQVKLRLVRSDVALLNDGAETADGMDS